MNGKYEGQAGAGQLRGALASGPLTPEGDNQKMKFMQEAVVYKDVRIDGLYLHNKRRRIYRVACVSTLDDLVLRLVTFQDVIESTFYSRTVDSFLGYNENGKRFTYIGQHYSGV